MIWNHDMTAAPRDGTHVILAMPNKTTLRSYWVECKHEPSHWCMQSHKVEPVAWMAWPEHPFAAAKTSEAAQTPAPMNVSLPDTDERSGEGANTGECPDEKLISTTPPQKSAVEPVSSSTDHLYLEDVGSGA